MFNKMARLWLTVTVLILTQNVFANIRNCDECIRSGSKWCSDKNDDDLHCNEHLSDDLCLTIPEPVTMSKLSTEKTIFIGKTESIEFQYKATEQQEIIMTMNTTQPSGNNFVAVNIEDYHDCNEDDEQCIVEVLVNVKAGFCTNSSTTREYINIHLKVQEEEADFKYHVACACECSGKVERKSMMCYGHGDYSCGVCACYKGWTGSNCRDVETSPTTVVMPMPNLHFEFMSPKCNYRGDLIFEKCKCYNGWSGGDCSVKKCESSRGDVQCTHTSKNDVTCSGNGVCDEECQTCFCHNNRTGSQYFDWNNYCSDICMDTSGCDQCLTSNNIGNCHHQHVAECLHNITVYEYNDTMAKEMDQYKRATWVSCNETFRLETNEPCHVRYVAKKISPEHIAVMIVESCNTVSAAGMGGQTGANASLIVGIVLAIAAVAVIGGLAIWKYMNAVPPLPLTDPQYQNIDAEDCTGENPLYKPPTSNYKNPTYGKW